MKRDFKGIWIPKEIWLTEDLTVQEKLFFVEIDSLDNEKGCFASNQYFADFFNISKTRVSVVISSLISKGYVTSTLNYKEGTKQILSRVLKISLIGYPRKVKEGIKQNRDTPIKEKFKDNNTVINNTVNNTFNKGSENEFQPKKDNSIYSKIKLIFAKRYLAHAETEYYFTAKDGAKVNSIIKQLKHAYKTSGKINPTDNEMVTAFEVIMDRAIKDRWLGDNFNLSNIDSQFNNLKINNRRNGQSHSEATAEITANLAHKYLNE